MSTQNELAANSTDGVYNCENGIREVFRDEDFYSALATCGDDTIYGLVTDEWAMRIDKEYGIS